jgi:hypothetical protein
MGYINLAKVMRVQEGREDVTVWWDPAHQMDIPINEGGLKLISVLLECWL